MIWCPCAPAAPITDITTSTQEVTASDTTVSNGNIDVNFDTGQQGGLLLDDFTVQGGDVYDVLNLPFAITIQRSGNQGGTKNNRSTLNYFLKNGAGDPFNPIGDRISGDTMESAFNSRDLSAGVENMFQNNNDNFAKDVERVDYVYSGGITLASSDDPSEYGFAFFERDGNNVFNVAAVTGIDGNNAVTSIGDIIKFGNGQALDYGSADLTGYDDTARLRGVVGDALEDYEINGGIIGGQDLGGIFISTADLGIGVDETFYGYVLFGGDIDAADFVGATTAELNDFDNSSFYGQNTDATNGGGDLYGGGMIFQLRGSPPPGGGTILDIQNYYWDVNNDAVGAVNDSSVGQENGELSDTWSVDAGNEYWGSRLGGIETVAWADNKRAVFSAGGDGPSDTETGSADLNTYTVEVKAGETVKAAGLRFEEGTVTITEGDAASDIELNRINGETPEIDVHDGLTATIESSISGTDGFDFRDNETDDGDSRLVLKGDNTISGTATVEEGTLELAGTGTNSSLGNIDTIDMQGGTLLLSATDEINDTGDIILNGGDITVSDNFDHSDTVGTLTLNENSTIDMGTRGGGDQSVINFEQSDGITWDGTKQWSITNWSGIGSLDGEIGVKDPTATGGGGSDQIYFGGDLDGLTLAQLSQIKFINPEGYAPGTYSAIILPDGEIVPVVPEASSVVALLTLLATVLIHRHGARPSRSLASASRRSL